MNSGDTLLSVADLVVEYFAGRRRKIRAVSGVTLDLKKGETVGLVGESGCGKSSLARAVIQLPRPTSGHVFFHSEDLTRLDTGRLRRLRPRIQMIFQDSVAALNPRRRAGETIAMPLRINGVGDRGSRLSKAREMMHSVGLDPDTLDQRPFQFSGGQCQRIQLARALIMAPEILICDEPVSSLDVSIQAQIINLLEEMRTRYGLSMLFISHDMVVVKNVSDRIVVMYLGRFCETAPAEELFFAPAHPYTAALISAIPSPQVTLPVKRINIRSVDIPSPFRQPPGCSFHTRCPFARSICKTSEPELVDSGPGRRVACHFPII